MGCIGQHRDLVGRELPPVWLHSGDVFRPVGRSCRESSPARPGGLFEDYPTRCWRETESTHRSFEWCGRIGTVCWIKARGVVFRSGTAVHMLGIGVDITSLKETEQSRQESEDKYLLLLNSTAEGIYGLDLKGNCTFCNPACLRLLGYQAPEELLGKNMHALMHHTRAEWDPVPRGRMPDLCGRPRRGGQPRRRGSAVAC